MHGNGMDNPERGFREEEQAPLAKTREEGKIL
jgi:hypothetical protein